MERKPVRRRAPWKRLPHGDVLLSSSSLFGTTVVTSVLGFAYWWVLARVAPPAELGAASSSISALTLLSSIGIFGLGTMLIAELAREPNQVRHLLPTCMLTSLLLSLLLAGGYIAVNRYLGSGLQSSVDSPAGLALFTVGVALTCALMVFDQASVGLAISQVQLWRNSAFAIAKMALVPIVPFVAGGSEAILGTWVAGLAMSVAVIYPWLRRRGIPLFGRPRWSALSGLAAVTWDHNVLNLSLSVPRMAAPVVVGALLPGVPAAAFYTAMMVANFLYLVPTHLSMSLFAISAGDRHALHRKLRLTLGISLIVGLVSVPAVAVLARTIMSSFGSEYARSGAACLGILTVGYLPQVIKQHFAAIMRVRGQVRLAGILVGASAVAELVAIYLGARLGSLVAIAGYQVIVLMVELIVMVPTVASALRATVKPVTVANQSKSQAAPRPRGGSRRIRRYQPAHAGDRHTRREEPSKYGFPRIGSAAGKDQVATYQRPRPADSAAGRVETGGRADPP